MVRAVVVGGAGRGPIDAAARAIGAAGGVSKMADGRIVVVVGAGVVVVLGVVVVVVVVVGVVVVVVLGAVVVGAVVVVVVLVVVVVGMHSSVLKLPVELPPPSADQLIM